VHALDRYAWAEPYAGGPKFPATGGLVPPGIPGHVAGIGLPFDPGRARELLSAAGYTEGYGLPEIAVLGFGGTQGFLEALKGQWQRCLGAEIETIVIAEFPGFLERLQEDPTSVHLLGCAVDYPDPDSIFRDTPFLGRIVGVNALVERARTVRDQEARMRLYQRAERMLARDAQIVPVLYSREDFLVKPWITGLSPSLGYWCFKDVVIEPH
jgi:oligopeptide transport system substrate-binding protein